MHNPFIWCGSGGKTKRTMEMITKPIELNEHVQSTANLRLTDDKNSSGPILCIFHVTFKYVRFSDFEVRWSGGNERVGVGWRGRQRWPPYYSNRNTKNKSRSTIYLNILNSKLIFYHESVYYLCMMDVIVYRFILCPAISSGLCGEITPLFSTKCLRQIW